ACAPVACYRGHRSVDAVQAVLVGLGGDDEVGSGSERVQRQGAALTVGAVDEYGVKVNISEREAQPRLGVVGGLLFPEADLTSGRDEGEARVPRRGYREIGRPAERLLISQDGAHVQSGVDWFEAEPLGSRASGVQIDQQRFQARAGRLGGERDGRGRLRGAPGFAVCGENLSHSEMVATWERIGIVAARVMSSLRSRAVR